MSKVAELLAENAEKSEAARDGKQVRALLKEVRRLKGIISAAHAIRTEQVDVQAVRGRLSPGKRRAVALALASDWHVEERVDARKVGGLNHFNPRIADFRAQRFFDAIIHMVKTYQKSIWEIRNLALPLNGDLITGFIHEELKETNYKSPTKATVFASRLISRGLTQLREELPEVHIWLPCQPGNHGRTTAKSQIATYVDNSYEWLLYHMLREKHPECTWQIGAGLHTVFRVYGMRIHQHHGDTVRSLGGVGGIMVPLMRAALGWQRKYQAQLSLISHFHQYLPGGRVIVNGSLVGYGAYSDSLPLAEPEPPVQAFGLIDEKRGLCQQTGLWCGDFSEEKKLR